ncbi:hypothetical protein O6H91_20G059800 [Diphasiastrum complanatum]|uniref:Uncharacterized protein n=1 Tax=Diphasiastrum complanatum TaxID=34168 RepID=A0ACC2AQW2_DIPCM|nr:hypothetical protein O6H91_20G059800 [Diphasiastrum complanatum]
MSTAQHRCVFVGNIPYDASEEQLVQICEEVGPVVSFRLVADRETGKPKGYGFCEFRDEETALSARRNLQGYEINGRQLRVDFAENEKGNSGERSRDQGRGGPGLSSSADVHRQSGSLSLSGVAPTDHPIGYAAAAAAATAMVGALGGSQQPPMMPGLGQSGTVHDSGQMNGHPGLFKASDPLTSYLASMSKNQLCDILSQMKAFVQQNQQEARQILAAKPHLTKALLQVQILLGMVHPHQLSQLTPSTTSASSQTIAAGVSSSVNLVPLMPLYIQQPPSMIPSKILGISSQQLLPPLPSQPRPPVPPPAPLMPPMAQTHPSQSMSFQVPPAQQQIPPQPAFQVNFPQFSTGITFQGLPPLPPQQLAQQIYQIGSGSSIASTIQMVADSGSTPSIAQSGSLGAVGMGLGGFPPNGRVNGAVGLSGMVLSGTLSQAQPSSRELDISGVVQVGQIGNTALAGSSSTSNMDFTGAVTASISSSLAVKAGQTFLGENTRIQQRPSALVGGIGGSLDSGFSGASTTQPQVYSQVQIPAEVDQQKVLLQQVINLTPEQINSLPPDQRQQVLQLQQALR